MLGATSEVSCKSCSTLGAWVREAPFLWLLSRKLCSCCKLHPWGLSLPSSCIAKSANRSASPSARQSKDLRSLDATIPWELRQLHGEYLHTEKLSMQGLLYAKGYAAQGIEMTWPAMGLLENSARMAVSDDFSEMLAELTFAILEQHARRHLVFSHGLPRRQVCLLDETLGPLFIDQLKLDIDIHKRISELHFDGVELYLQRSLFHHTAVKQLIGCLEEEGWTITPRTEGGGLTKFIPPPAKFISGAAHFGSSRKIGCSPMSAFSAP